MYSVGLNYVPVKHRTAYWLYQVVQIKYAKISLLASNDQFNKFGCGCEKLSIEYFYATYMLLNQGENKCSIY